MTFTVRPTLVICATLLAITGLGAQGPARPASKTPYFPERFEWQRRTPVQAGMDAAKLDAAIQLAIARENPATKDLATDLATTFGAREPFDTPIGPVQPRGAMNGLIVRNGYI